MKLRIVALAALFGGLLLAAGTVPAIAKSAKAPIHKVSDKGIEDEIGFITFTEGPNGVEMLVELMGLTPGAHAMHVHENGSCEAVMKDGKSVAALAAGGHYDPAKTNTHAGPMGAGHKGDLPVLEADKDGKVKANLKAPNVKIADVKGRSVIIHANGDNYTDQPALGGGGGRVACGVIK